MPTWRRSGWAIALDTIPIGDVVDAVERTLAPTFAGRERDITEENIQARARGLLLMAVSNKFGAMLLTTGNKSEMSVGYATLYGDMCGGYSVLKDLYKTEVYALAEWRNRCVPEGALGPAGEVIPAIGADQGADRRAAAQPEGPGHAARIRGARRDADRPGRAGAQRRRDRGATGIRATSSAGRRTCCSRRSTSAARRLPA